MMIPKKDKAAAETAGSFKALCPSKLRILSWKEALWDAAYCDSKRLDGGSDPQLANGCACFNKNPFDRFPETPPIRESLSFLGSRFRRVFKTDDLERNEETEPGRSQETAWSRSGNKGSPRGGKKNGATELRAQKGHDFQMQQSSHIE